MTSSPLTVDTAVTMFTLWLVDVTTSWVVLLASSVVFVSVVVLSSSVVLDVLDEAAVVCAVVDAEDSAAVVGV